MGIHICRSVSYFFTIFTAAFAAIFAALNINILSIAYEPVPSPRRIYTTDLPLGSSSYAFAEEWAASTIHDASDATVERSTIDSASRHVTFLVEFKARVTSSDYVTQSKWVKFPVTVSVDELDDAPDYVYGQIIDQVLQAREQLQTPALWPSLTALERGE